MWISTIIITYNRVKDLDECLNSISIQTRLPREVLVIDNGTDAKTNDLIEERKKEFRKKGMILKYIKNVRENSLTIAKNIGIKYSTGNLISFLDDDCILDRKYYEEILKVFIERPNAIGVGFLLMNKKRGIMFTLIDFFNKLFFIESKEKKNSKCKMLPSLGISYPAIATEIISCEWLSGASTYRRNILEKFKFDENLKKYSWGEDQDLSYRIFKKYPNSLFMTPYAKYIHKASREGRIPKKELIYMEEVYPFYLFYKIIDQNLKNKLIYFWSKTGRLIFNILVAIFKYKLNFSLIEYRIGALFFCVKHTKEIKKGDLNFFNKTLL